MKHMLKNLLVVAILLLATLSTWAYDFEVDGIFYNRNSDGTTVSVTSGDQIYSGSVVIPSTVTYRGTTHSVTSIGKSAFACFNGLTSVTIPNSVTSIGEKAFYGCSGLTSVIYNATNCITMGTFSSPIFSTCTNLKSLTIGENVKSIPNYAFKDCTGLTSVTIGNSVTSIGECAFYDCSKLTSVTIGNSVTSIGRKAFYDCSRLTKVEISDIAAWCSIRFGSDSANPLYHAEHLYLNGKEVTNLVIPNSVTSIGSYAFYRCSGLTSVTIPNSVTSIGSYAFYGCSGLTSVTIPNSVTSIGGSAFERCSGLTSVTIPNSVTKIGYDAFENCSGLTKVEISDIAAWCKISFGNLYSNPLYYAHHLYQNGKEVTNLVIPNSVTSIGNDAFYNCSGLTSVTIPNSVTSIGDSAFYNCSGLTSVTIPNSVTSIGSYAFYGCSGLTSVTIPNSVTSIGADAFYNCSGLTSVTICNSVTSIGESAFYNCSGLTSVTIPNSVTSIGEKAFYGCSGLTSVTIPNSVTSIGYGAFYNCSGLTTIIVESGNTVYDSRENCNAIIETGSNTLIFGCQNTTIPNTVTSIGNDAFYNCSGLTSVTIPNSVTSIGNYAFYNCSGLTSVTIGNSVTSIGESAFYNCSGLTSVTIGNSVTSIGESAFYNCSGLTSVTIPNSVTSIGNDAFENCSGLKQLTIQDGTSTLSLGYNSSDYLVSEGLFYDSPLESVYLGRDLSYDTSKNRGYSPFYGKSTIKELTIGNSVTSISDNLFCGCNGLTSLTIGNSVSSISKGVFDFTSLKQLTIQDGSSTLSMGYNSASISSTGTGKGLFYDAPLEIIYLGRNLTYESSSKYGYSPFYGISTIKELTIGNSVTSIGVNLFGGCSGLTSVIYNAENCTTESSIFSSCTNLTSLTIGDKVKSIPSSIFADCSGLTSVIIPNSVTSIGSSAFSGCGGLTSVTIGSSVASIGYAAFENCSGLKQLTIQDGTSTLSLGYNSKSSSSSSVGEGLFYDSPLESVYLGRDLSYDTSKSCGYSPFYGNSTIKELTIGNSVTSIGDYAFWGCIGLTSVTIGNSVTSIGDYAFWGCSGLTSVTIGNSVTSIGTYAFYTCSGLKSVTIPNSVTSIGYGAFASCSGLTVLTIGNSVTSIGDYAFWGCSGLTSVTIPNSVSSIGACAFSDCNLTSVTIPNSVTSIGTYAFICGRGLRFVRLNATLSNVPTSGVFNPTNYIIGETVKSIPANTLLSITGGVSMVIALADTPPTATRETFGRNVTEDATLYVKKNTVSKYFMADGWCDFTNIKTIDNLVTNISLDKTSVNLSLGETCKLNAIVEPADATLTDIFWTASNSCVSVDQDGNVTGLSDGQCVVTAEAIDGTGIKAECVVNVGNIYAQSLRLSQETLALEVNGMAKLSCTILPGDTTIKTVEWSCSNESVATFNENADNTITVVGVESGVATITVRTTDGSNLAAICTVYVGEAGAETIDSDAVKVTSKGGAIRISGAAGAVAEVYSLSGMLLYCGTDTSIALPRGVYIVKVAGTTTKVIL